MSGLGGDLDVVFMGGFAEAVGELGEGGLFEELALGGCDVVPDFGQHSQGGRGGGGGGLDGVLERTVDGGHDLAESDFFGGLGELVSAGGAASADDVAGAFELDENLDEVAGGDAVGVGDRADADRAVFVVVGRQL